MSVKFGKLKRYGAGGKFRCRYKGPNMTGWENFYSGTSDRKEAQARLERFITELKAGQLPTEMADWRLTESEQWWNEFRRPRISQSNLRSEPYRLQHLARVIGNVRLKEITNHHLDTYQTRRLEQGISAEAINRELRLWSQILTKAKLWHRLKDDYHPLPVKVNPIGQALTRAELRHLAETAKSNVDWEAAFYSAVLAANTGMRNGEVASLCIGEIHVAKRRLKLSHAKSDAGVRRIELNADASEAVARLLIRARELGATHPEHYLLPKNLSRITYGEHKGERGYDPLQHQTDWGTAWSSLTKAAGFPSLRFHDLRHTFITHMVERGVPLGTIMAMVGHIAKRMLLHYTHISSGAARRAVELLDAEPMLDLVVTGEQPEQAKAEKKTLLQ
jgi:integrase